MAETSAVCPSCLRKYPRADRTIPCIHARLASRSPTEAEIEACLGFLRELSNVATFNEANPIWHDWVILDAFLAGIRWSQQRVSEVDIYG